VGAIAPRERPEAVCLKEVTHQFDDPSLIVDHKDGEAPPHFSPFPALATRAGWTRALIRWLHAPHWQRKAPQEAFKSCSRFVQDSFNFLALTRSTTCRTISSVLGHASANT
jgi:hypothetical protein